MTPYLKKLFELHPECEPSWREQLDYHPELGQTTWTAKQVEVLDQEHEDHYDSCDECQEGLAVDCPDPESHEKCLEDPDHACYLEGYCPIGRKTQTAFLNAEHEYSWQQDFPSQFEDVR